MKSKLFNILAFGIPLVVMAVFLIAVSNASGEPTTKCTTSDYAHIPYAEEYKFECTDDTMTIIDDYTNEVIATEQRCTEGQLKAEDGSCVAGDFYVNTDTIKQATAEGTSATTGGGIFINPNETTSVSNNTGHQMGVDLQPQKLSNGKWTDLGWSDYFTVTPRTGVLKSHFGEEHGTFRYKVTTYSYDKDGKAIEEDRFYTEDVYVK